MAGAATDCEDVYRVDFSYSFLKGIDSRRPPSSIVIPPKDLDAMAAMERQYWEIKSKNYGVVIFFKKGKFYELYDQDAAMAHREFGLKLVFDTTNRGKMRLAGVPEQTFSEWARLFVFRGYKVGRVEQMKDDEEPSKSARPKVMQRELVEILTPGTLTDPVMISGYGAIFILSLYPISVGRVDAMAVDLSRRVVYHCPCGLQSDGDTSVREENVFSEVSSLLQQLQPREIIFPSDAFDAHVNDANRSFNQRLLKWVEGEGFLVELIRPSDSSFHERPSEEKNAEQAKHFMAQYLRSLKLESAEAILSGAQHYNFHRTGQKVACRFTPLHEKRLSDSSVLSHERREDVGLVLDSTTVSNLELVTNLRDGSERGSLFNLINHCCTNGGRRLFRSWVLRPSASSRVINARQDAVRFIIENRLDEFWGKLEELPESVSSTPNLSLRSSVDIPTQGSTDTERPRLSGLKRGRPTNAFEARFASLLNVDFERNLSRLADLKESSTQVAFVDPLVQYKKHLQLILSTVEAFQEMLDWSRCARRNSAPPLLQELWGNIDAIAPALDSIESCFDHKVAQTTGIIVPSHGTSPAYDEASKRLETIESKLNEALDELREVFSAEPPSLLPILGVIASLLRYQWGQHQGNVHLDSWSGRARRLVLDILWQPWSPWPKNIRGLR
uniref:Uncharacterized protein TCIL3000_10_5490 n=1 Tax=Trypanosoma congolense (strain IL3000) TaxID=1068625 RepID=G0UWL7_TRYCI|nr:unnamed protein product [Trypanosoma congolense IL3000]